MLRECAWAWGTLGRGDYGVPPCAERLKLVHQKFELIAVFRKRGGCQAEWEASTLDWSAW